MSRQPSPLTDFGSQGSEPSDSEEYEDPTTMGQSHVATPAEPRLSKDCDVCHLTMMQCGQYRTPHYLEWKDYWKQLSTIRSSALDGRRCCSMFVDAIETWLRHADHRVHKALHVEPGLPFNNLEVSFHVYYLCPKPWNGQCTLNPLVKLRRQAGSNDDAKDPTGPVSLFIFTLHDTPPQHTDISSDYKFCSRRLPSGDTASLQAFRCLENWIATCVHSHTECKARLSGYVPKRVLEITQRGIILQENLSDCMRYACLSHCWGADGVAFKLTSANLGALKHGIELSMLPKTFRDAVQICARLQIPYLWIDALCIIQDDDDDWNRAVSTLADIYENAYLTIAATASPDGNGGCFSDPNSSFRARKLENSSLHVAEWHQGDDHIHEGWIRGLTHWPLMTRAWVFQERAVSPRIVHFTDNQLLWECNSMMKSESGNVDQDWTHEGLEYTYHFKRPFKYPISDSVESWHAVVEDYSQLHLTFSKDRLPALAAIVQRMLRVRKTDEYIVGLWKSSLLSDLMWHSRGMEKKPRSVLQLPSWTWASVTDAVVYRSEKNLMRVRSIGISYGSEVSTKQGYVDDITILLECFSCEGVIEWYPSTRLTPLPPLFHPSEENLVVPPPERFWAVRADYDYSTGSKPVKNGDAVVIAVTEWGRLDLQKWSGLVLRQVSQGIYERIGVCHMPPSDVDYSKGVNSISRKAKLRDNFEWRYYRSFVASLPVRSFRIV